MSERLTQSQANRLVKQYQKLYGEADAVLPPTAVAVRTLTEILDECDTPEERFAANGSESVFVVRARSQGGKVFRSGWPDFAVEMPNGKHYAIEVKARGDQVRPAQAKMFSLLGRMGIPVFIWNPRWPTRLTPWRAYVTRAIAKSKQDQILHLTRRQDPLDPHGVTDGPYRGPGQPTYPPSDPRHGVRGRR